MKTVTEQIAELCASIANAEPEMRAKIERDTAAIATLSKIPESFRAGKYSPHSAYTSGVITLNAVATLSDAILIAERANPDAMGLYRDGCASFRPLDKCPEGKEETESVCPYAVRLDGLPGCEELELFFFVSNGGATFDIRVPINSREIYRTGRRVDVRGGVRYEEVSAYDTTGHFPRKIQWASGGAKYMSDFTFYA